MTLETKYFDIAQHLNTTEEIRDFLQVTKALGCKLAVA
jgi:DNA-binding phage protein